MSGVVYLATEEDFADLPAILMSYMNKYFI